MVCTKVGIAGGVSISYMLNSVRRGDCQFIEMYPLAISPVIEAISLDANTLAGAFAYRHYGYHVTSYALPYASPPDDVKTLPKYIPTRRVLAKARTVDIAFMGLGVASRRTPLDLIGDVIQHQGFSAAEIQRRGVVGDIL